MPENEPTKDSPELEKPAIGAEANIEADSFFQFIQRRKQELQATGIPAGRAGDMARLEYRIARWPPEWRDELKIVIYGDFKSPETDLHFDNLGIIVEAGAVTGSIIRSATCVLKARVKISAKSIAGLVDAAARINMLLGVSAAIDWGNAGNGWWCHITHGSMSGIVGTLEQDAMQKVITHIQGLRSEVRRKVTSALYWIREPRQLMMEGYRDDTLRVYAGYWNAFECLVDAVCILRPQPKVGKAEKQSRIDKFMADRNCKLDAASIREIYRNFVDPGFVEKASHALRQCFPERADRYILECFRIKPEQDRLYDIRNAINHGDIDGGNLEELIRVEDKQGRLWMIVFGMLGQIIPIHRPLDSNLNS